MNNRYHMDPILLICIYTVAIAGILTLYGQENMLAESFGRWQRQMIFLGIGSILMMIMHRVNYQILAVYAFPIYAISILLLILTLIPGIGSEIKGARSWIRFGSFGFQTSEIAKLSTIILLAQYLRMKEQDMSQIPSLIIPFGITLLPVILIVMQPDLGSAFSLLPTLMIMLLLTGADIYHIGSLVLLAIFSLFIPLYIEYHNIVLVQPLLEYLEELRKVDLAPAVRILKTNIWDFINHSIIPSSIAEQDLPYLSRLLRSEVLMSSLRDASQSIRYQHGGYLLLFLANITTLIILGSIMTTISVILLIIRIARGVSFRKLRRVYIPLGILGVSFFTAVTIQSVFSFRYHQVARVTSFINPEMFSKDLAYQIRASKAAIGSGELKGRGFWKGEMTMGKRPLVPESYTDFIYTSWAERTGFIGAILLLLILISIPTRGLFLSSEARDRFGGLLSGGISCLFFFHITVNIGITLGLLPVTGLPLTFMSYGGSHMLISMIAVGILMSIYRRRFAN